MDVALVEDEVVNTRKPVSLHNGGALPVTSVSPAKDSTRTHASRCVQLCSIRERREFIAVFANCDSTHVAEK